MKEITLYNDSSSQMSVMALGKAISWNPKTTLNVSEDEAKVLLNYGHIKKYEDISANANEKAEVLEKEIVVLTNQVSALKAEIADLKKQLESKSEVKVEESKAESETKVKEVKVKTKSNESK